MPPPTEHAEVAARSVEPGDLPQRWVLLSVATTVFLVVNLLDIVLTVVLLYRGGHREANPLAEYILNHWGWEEMALFKVATTVVVCLIAQYVARSKPTAARRLLYVTSAIVAVVVFYSVVLLVRDR
jgi:hypothetical protein